MAVASPGPSDPSHQVLPSTQGIAPCLSLLPEFEIPHQKYDQIFPFPGSQQGQNREQLGRIVFLRL